MTKSKNTKRALLCSVLSVLLCTAMLVGSTFAWFTDSVTSGMNKIVAGNLEVELEYSKDGGAWDTVNAETSIFDNAAKWEPGYTEIVYLKVNNAGSLALKYQFAINVADKVIGETADGTDIDLSNFIKFGLVETDTPFAAGSEGRTAALAAVADNAALISAGYSSEEGHLAKGASSKMLALVVYMPEDVGNAANHGTGKQAPSIDMGISLVATQDTVESDSFDDQYDAGASLVLPDFVAANDAELSKVMDKLCNPEDPNYQEGDKDVVVELAPNTTYSEEFIVKQYPTWNGQLAGANPPTNIDYQNLDENDQLKVKFVGGEGTVIKGTVNVNGFGHNIGPDAELSQYVSTEFENITFDASDAQYLVTPQINLKAAATNVYFRNCTFKGGKHLLAGGVRHDTVFNINFIGCTFDNSPCISGYWTTLNIENCNGQVGPYGFLNLQSGGNITIKNSNVTCSAGSASDAYIIRTNTQAVIEAVDSSIAVTGGAPLLTLRQNGPKTITFNGCTLQYQTLVTHTNGSTPDTTTITIDGEQVTE